MTIEDLMNLSTWKLDFKACGRHAINKGQDWQQTVAVRYQPSSYSEEEDLDLSGFTAIGEIRSYTGASEIVATMDVTIDGNKIILALDKSVTANIAAPGKSPSAYTRYLYDVVLTDGTKSARVLQGSVDVCPGVTVEEDSDE